MSGGGWRSWGRRVRTYRAERFAVVEVLAAGRKVQLSATPSHVSLTWGTRAAPVPRRAPVVRRLDDAVDPGGV